MTKIMFVCYGNICRSTMAEFLAKKWIAASRLENEFYVCSAGTSTEELGNPVHYGTARILDRVGVDYSKKRAVQVKKAQYGEFDYFICMDAQNKRDLLRIFGGDPDGKIALLLDYTDLARDVADPYYTRNFEQTYLDVCVGLKGLFSKIKG